MKKIFIFSLGVLLLSCGDSKESGYAYDSLAAVEEVATSVNGAKAIIPGETSGETAKLTEQKIIKRGNLRFQTSDLDKTYHQIDDAVKKYKAQVQSDTEGTGYRSLFRSLTIRVPSKDFENLVQEVSTGVAYFDTKEIYSEDVTEQYIDIQARLKAKTELENRYLDLLQKATKVSEILEIEKELSVIREEIEAKQGQLNYLQSRVSMSTLHIYFYKQTADTGITISYGSKMWNAIKSGIEAISSFFLGLLHIWPFIILSIVAFYVIRKRIRIRKKQ